MAASTEHLRMHFGPLERQVKQLLNNDLKEICRREGLPISGVKAVLQNRVLDRKLFRRPKGNCTDGKSNQS